MSRVYVVMGVSGSGKTTIGKKLAKQLSVPFYDADDFHPQVNVDKMASGIPLEDRDRWPWLDVLAQNMSLWRRDGAVLACSALKKQYRERLASQADVHFIYLEATFEVIQTRLAARKNHFFNPALLQSQFDTLEAPENAITISVNLEPDEIITKLMNTLTGKASLGLVGLGVMGKSLARNFASKGISIALYNRHVSGKEEKVASNFVKEYAELSNSKGFDDVAEFVQSLSLPRKIFLMVNAGPAVDAVIDGLLPYLEAGDVLMDGGNSHYKDTQRRFDTLAKKGIHFLGVGVSGGEKGALEGPSIMPGGSKDAYNLISAYLEKIAARDRNGVACCTRVGDGGSGHFVKMIHNGIEYAEMQLIAEVYAVLKNLLRLDNETISNHFKEWNSGELGSYLLEISGNILTRKEGDKYLLDLILDKAKQKGTGGWSATAALEIGASLDTISQAVMARIVSGYKSERTKASALYSLKRLHSSGTEKGKAKISIRTVQKAYAAARIINHCLGIEALRKASSEYNWHLNLAEITRIWTNGCIIRSKFMESLAPLLLENEQSLFLSGKLSVQIKEALEDLIAFTQQALDGHIATPVFSAAVNYILAFAANDSAANMIQAQRDYFGAHTYERVDKEGTFHTKWED